LDITQNTIISGLSQLTAKDFVRISKAYPITGEEAIEITYRFDSVEVIMTFNVQDPLTLDSRVAWNASNKSDELTFDDETHALLAKTFCTHDLFVLIKRYQFLLNSSYSDESLKEFFTADRQANPTRIEFYPLMNLVTAYYESH
jgi:hypothetical protein